MSLKELWVNDFELTSLVQTVGGNNFSSLTYSVSFREPSNTAVLGIKGFESSEVYSAGLRLICNCTRPSSAWNFYSSLNSGWKSVSSTRTPNFTSDSFRDGWYSNSYVGPSSNAIGYSGPPLALNLDTLICGPQVTANSLGHPQGLTSPRSWFWGLRRFVNQTVPCNTDAPIASPTVFLLSLLRCLFLHFPQVFVTPPCHQHQANQL